MNKITTKVLTFFWLLSGLVWVFVSVKHIMDKEGMVILYIITAIVAFILSFNFYKQWKK